MSGIEHNRIKDYHIDLTRDNDNLYHSHQIKVRYGRILMEQRNFQYLCDNGNVASIVSYDLSTFFREIRNGIIPEIPIGHRGHSNYITAKIYACPVIIANSQLSLNHTMKPSVLKQKVIHWIYENSTHFHLNDLSGRSFNITYSLCVEIYVNQIISPLPPPSRLFCVSIYGNNRKFCPVISSNSDYISSTIRGINEEKDQVLDQIDASRHNISIITKHFNERDDTTCSYLNRTDTTVSAELNLALKPHKDMILDCEKRLRFQERKINLFIGHYSPLQRHTFYLEPSSWNYKNYASGFIQIAICSTPRFNIARQDQNNSFSLISRHPDGILQLLKKPGEIRYNNGMYES